ncbi:hypothetical protein BCR43DRAFT_506471 [Syncephalastrum racemosum]|uniref:F-box domain-containing protein n=1 Tax=Syncephalastrum racemosum TaxID=13706 RepID=A0A1X2H8Q9_SYNRA|nr:hypothetical protein BCR43DRAFT_506471 [Syncephalastrum racemosum]
MVSTRSQRRSHERVATGPRHLPAELWNEIFMMLDPVSLFGLELSCSYVAGLLSVKYENGEYIWRKQAERLGLPNHPIISPKRILSLQLNPYIFGCEICLETIPYSIIYEYCVRLCDPCFFTHTRKSGSFTRAQRNRCYYPPYKFGPTRRYLEFYVPPKDVKHTRTVAHTTHVRRQAEIFAHQMRRWDAQHRDL